MNKPLRGLKSWVKHISQMELPSLSNILQELNRITDDHQSSVQELADVILKDASMTAQVLRVANSVQFNPGGQTIHTISKAIVQIGFNEIKAISTTVLIIDTLLTHSHNDNFLLDTIARSFHAAIQAKNIAYNLSPEKREEIFIAALLYHLGEMAFLACHLPQVDEYIQQVNDNPQEKAAICLDILGVGFGSITKALCKEWDLGPLVIQALERPEHPTRSVAAVLMGEAISQTVNKGWQSREMRRLVSQVSRFTGQNDIKTEDLIVAGADEASAVAKSYGAEKICHLLPSGSQLRDIQPESTESATQLQLKFLHELTDLTLERADINRVFLTVIQGLNRGVLIKRCAVALFDMQREYLEARYFAGHNTQLWKEQFRMPVMDSDYAKDVFSIALIQYQPIWMGQDQSLEKLRYQALRKILPDGDCFVAPITYRNRNIGVIYGDGNGDRLTSTQFNDFCLFAKQTNLGLSILIKDG
ncbi:HDOD domain-containing protein [Gynuella sunshinyii]|uniref:Putative signal transduction protein n=1 Tax=Gynuella sunshinyii YC6258 TaxID=1445510 RepID=A0A0C5VH37_9GAMM|nr:HDOD domain-containing protein [Gynuella sunshinyii]AJQ93551.1 putative signal transduction protein [Gynuella sunshinyii YC6258]